MVARGWGRELSANAVFVLGDENVLKLDGGDGCATLRID